MMIRLFALRALTEETFLGECVVLHCNGVEGVYVFKNVVEPIHPLNTR